MAIPPTVLRENIVRASDELVKQRRLRDEAAERHRYLSGHGVVSPEFMRRTLKNLFNITGYDADPESETAPARWQSLYDTLLAGTSVHHEHYTDKVRELEARLDTLITQAGESA